MYVVRWLFNLAHKLRTFSLRKHAIHQTRSISAKYERAFVVVITSYNNEAYCIQNLHSVLCQCYNNYRVVFIDDCSVDLTWQRINEFVCNHKQASRVTLLRNQRRRYKLANLYRIIHDCRDDEIVIELDGDDYLTHEQVLSHVNAMYVQSNALLVYSAYKNVPEKLSRELKVGFFSYKTPSIIMHYRWFRQYPWIYSGLRSYYAWLFKKIKKIDLLDEGGIFFQLMSDLAIMYPMLEMASSRIAYIEEPLLMRTIDSSGNDFKKYDKRYRAHIRDIILSKKVYEKLI